MMRCYEKESLMKIDISTLLSGNESEITFSYTLLSEDAPSGVVFPKPFEVNGRITDNAGYMALTLRADVAYETECARCLEPIKGVFPVDFERTVALPGTLIDENDDDYVVVEDSSVDVDIPLLEQILLLFPSKILCHDDCKGLCPKCGKNLNEGKCSCPDHEPDPRLAVLAKLLEED